MLKQHWLELVGDGAANTIPGLASGTNLRAAAARFPVAPCCLACSRCHGRRDGGTCNSVVLVKALLVYPFALPSAQERLSSISHGLLIALACSGCEIAGVPQPSGQRSGRTAAEPAVRCITNANA